MRRPAPSGRLWLGWVWRDLRSQWVAVVAIGFVLAIGAGVYSGLGSTATWLRTSYDHSFDELSIHDIRFELSSGTFTDQGQLREAVESASQGVALSVAERLVVDSQVDTAGATSDGGTLVVARLVGMDLTGSVGVDELWLRDGSAAAGAVVEAKFADAAGIDATGTLLAAGGASIEYSGTGLIPEDFYYEGPPGSLLSLGELGQTAAAQGFRRAGGAAQAFRDAGHAPRGGPLPGLAGGVQWHRAWSRSTARSPTS